MTLEKMDILLNKINNVAGLVYYHFYFIKKYYKYDICNVNLTDSMEKMLSRMYVDQPL